MHRLQYTNVRFRESEPEENSTFGRRHLRDNIVFGQIHLVVIRSCFFSFVSEPASPLFFVEFRFTHHRHNGELSVIVYPWAGLMSLFESTDFIGCIDILPSVSHFPVCGVQKFIPQGRAMVG